MYLLLQVCQSTPPERCGFGFSITSNKSKAATLDVGPSSGGVRLSLTLISYSSDGISVQHPIQKGIRSLGYLELEKQKRRRRRGGVEERRKRNKHEMMLRVFQRSLRDRDGASFPCSFPLLLPTDRAALMCLKRAVGLLLLDSLLAAN